MTSRVKQWYPVVLALIAAGMSAAVYSRLPDMMAVHWDIGGNPNGWMPRAVGAAFGPVFIILLTLLLRFVPRIDPRAENYARFGEAYEVIVASVLILMLVVHGIVLAVALGYHVSIARIVPALVGALFVVIGNMMPLVRPNWWFGFRTPWTLSNDRVWARTHRLGGYCMTAGGILMIVAALALPPSLGIPVLIAVAIASTFGPVVYSYLTWKREEAR
ncbi:MAG TPA: SdpI family protein [Gemmatimonadaceae bacterium]